MCNFDKEHDDWISGQTGLPCLQAHPCEKSLIFSTKLAAAGSFDFGNNMIWSERICIRCIRDHNDHKTLSQSRLGSSHPINSERIKPYPHTPEKPPHSALNGVGHVHFQHHMVQKPGGQTRNPSFLCCYPRCYMASRIKNPRSKKTTNKHRPASGDPNVWATQGILM